MKTNLLISFILFSFSIGIANAGEIYSCGPGCYTSSPKKGYGKADIGKKIGRYTAVTPSHRTSEVANSSNSVAKKTNNTVYQANKSSKPKIQNTAYTPAPTALSNAQTSSRRAILEQELNNERIALSQAQKALADGRISRDANQIRRLESAVLDRQQNIQALQRELGRM